MTAAESVAVPLSEVSEPQFAAIRRELRERLLHTLQNDAQLEPDMIVLRDLVPGDYSGTDPDGQFVNQVLGVANTYVAALDADPTLSDTEAWGIYGILSPTAIPTLGQVRFGIGGSATIAQFYVEPALAMDGGVLFTPPVIFRPNDVFNWDILFTGATAADSEVIHLLGMVAEKAGTSLAVRP